MASARKLRVLNVEGRNYRLQDIQLVRAVSVQPSAFSREFFDIVWDDSTFAPHGASVGRPRKRFVRRGSRKRAEGETPGNQVGTRSRPDGAAGEFPCGHMREVTPVPIPNTEVKPSTADGTARANCVGE